MSSDTIRISKRNREPRVTYSDTSMATKKQKTDSTKNATASTKKPQPKFTTPVKAAAAPKITPGAPARPPRLTVDERLLEISSSGNAIKDWVELPEPQAEIQLPEPQAEAQLPVVPDELPVVPESQHVEPLGAQAEDDDDAMMLQEVLNHTPDALEEELPEAQADEDAQAKEEEAYLDAETEELIQAGGGVNYGTETPEVNEEEDDVLTYTPAEEEPPVPQAEEVPAKTLQQVILEAEAHNQELLQEEEDVVFTGEILTPLGSRGKAIELF